MKKILETIKEYAIIFIAAIGAIFGIFLIFSRRNDRYHETMKTDAGLEGELKQVDDDIDKLKEDLGKDVPDLTDTQIEDYWNK